MYFTIASLNVVYWTKHGNVTMGMCPRILINSPSAPVTFQKRRYTWSYLQTTSPCPTADDTITIPTYQKAVVLELKLTLCSPQRLTIFINDIFILFSTYGKLYTKMRTNHEIGLIMDLLQSIFIDTKL